MRCTGPLDEQLAPALIRVMLGELRAGVRLLCLDLCAVTDCDDAGIAAIINARRYVLRKRGVLTVAVEDGPVGELLEATGVAEVTRVHPSRDAAVTSISRFRRA